MPAPYKSKKRRQTNAAPTKFKQMCIRLRALLSLLGKQLPSFTGWKELGSYMSQSDIFGVFQMGDWNAKDTKEKNVALMEEALSRVEQNHERAANAEIASRPAPNESALELRVRSVLLQLEIPTVGANYKCLPIKSCVVC